MNMKKNINYGLILPKNSQKINFQKPSIFNEDSDEGQIIDDTKNEKLSEKKTFIKKQVQLDIEKALNEDPNCFEYDKIYEDEMAKKKELQKKKTTDDLRPKYIKDLMKAAEERKKEYERRIERTVQKERELEKGMYDDKEAFVTDAYKQKMKKIKEEEELEKKKQKLEDLQDVTKQENFNAFYRHILDQKTGAVLSKPKIQNIEIGETISSNINFKKSETIDVLTKKKSILDKKHEGKYVKSENKNKKEFYSDKSISDEDVEKTSHNKNKHKSKPQNEEFKSKKKRNENHSDYHKKRDISSYKNKNNEKNKINKCINNSKNKRNSDFESFDFSSENENKYRKKQDSQMPKDISDENVLNTIKDSFLPNDQKLEKNSTEIIEVKKHEKRTVGESLDYAKTRYLARKMANQTTFI